MSISLSLYLYISISLSLYLYLCLCLYPSLSLSVYVSIFVSLHLSISLTSMYRILRTDSVACPGTKYNKIAYRQRAFLTTLNKNKCNCVGGVGIASRLGKRTVAQLERERDAYILYMCVCLSLFFLCFYSSISLYISLSLYLFMYSIHPFQPLPPLPPLPPFPPLSSLPSFPSLPSKSTEV